MQHLQNVMVDSNDFFILHFAAYYNVSLGHTATAYNEFCVLLLESLVPLTELVGHQFELIPLLLAGVQLFRQNQKSFFLTLQLPLADYELHERTNVLSKREES